MPSGRRRRSPAPAADSIPRVSRKRQRARPPRGLESPFAIPISTVDWLLSRESLAARYVTLRTLLGRPTKDLELRKAKQALGRDPYVRDVLPLLRKRLSSEWANEELERRYQGGYWLVLFLAEMGCDQTHPEIRHAADVLLTRWEKVFVQVERSENSRPDHRLFSMICRTLALIGFSEDSRVLAGAESLARASLSSYPDRRPGSLGRTARDLLLFGAIPEARRPDLVEKAQRFLVERALGTLLPPEGASQGQFLHLLFGFPTGDADDLLELLDALVLTGVERRPELQAALLLVAEKADHRGRWKLERSLGGQMPVDLERAGELSRWITIRALRVLQHFCGLTVEKSS